ncbi:MAG: glycosyltransferase family 4 protein [Lentisphaeraceae bacterium]|nr:glycosyltransferase family 4 protein [Lentisphaeraceae bacterium]
MKIALLAFSALPRMGGAEVFSFNFIRHMINLGHEVHVYLPNNVYKEFMKLSPFDEIRVYRILYRDLFFINRLPVVLDLRLVLAQKINQYDVWQVVGVHPSAHCTRLLSRFVPVVVRAFGADVQKMTSINYGVRIDPKTERKISKTLKYMKRLVALTPSIAENYTELGVGAERIVEISNGIDLEQFSIDVDRNVLRRKLGVENDELLLLTTGRYHIKKGYEVIPEALRILLDKGIKIKWVVIGKKLQAIQHLIDKFAVKENLIIVDEISIDSLDRDTLLPCLELLKFYKSADLYVLPSLIEGMSNAMLEAFGADLPVITTDSPGCRDLIKDGHNGLLAEPDHPVSLAGKIESYVSDKDLQELLISNIISLKQQYDWKQVVLRYEELYKSLL